MAFKDGIKNYFKDSRTLAAARIKKIVLSAPFWVTLCALALIIIGIVRISVITGARSDQYMAQNWSQGSDVGYRHMAVYARGARSGDTDAPLTYIDSEVSLRKSDIATIRSALQAVVDTGNASASKKTDTDSKPRGYEDAYSSVMTTTVSTVTEETDSISVQTECELVGIGGNFKVFHPFRYMSGGFLPETPYDMHQVVVNDILAWKFYNSYDITGEKIIIGTEEYTIIGVVQETQSSIDEMAGTDCCRAYVYFDSLSEFLSGASDIPSSDDSVTSEDYYGDSSSSSSELAIQCYEAMLPELVTGVAITDMKNALPDYSFTEPAMYVVSVTDRFSISRVWNRMIPIGKFETETAGYEFPYWESAAQLAAEHVFYDGCLIAAGSVLLIIGSIMIVLRFRKRNSADEEPEKKGE